MVYSIDIDNTICTDTNGQYHFARPMRDRIEKVNRLFDEGHTIILETGRHWNNLPMTVQQLHTWGVKYHTLVMGKVPADIKVDDKAIDDVSFFRGML